MALDQTQDQPRSATETGTQMTPGASSPDDVEKYFLSIEKAIEMNKSPEQAADDAVGEIDHEADEELAKDSALASGIEDTEIEIQVSASQKVAEAEIEKRSAQAKAEIVSALAPSIDLGSAEESVRREQRLAAEDSHIGTAAGMSGSEYEAKHLPEIAEPIPAQAAPAEVPAAPSLEKISSPEESVEALNAFVSALENDADPEADARNAKDYAGQNAMYDDLLKMMAERKDVADAQMDAYAGMVPYLEGAKKQNILRLKLEDLKTAGAPADQLAAAEAELAAQSDEVKKILAANPGMDPDRLIASGMPAHAAVAEGIQRRTDAEAGMSPEQQTANSQRREIAGIMKDMAKAKLDGVMEKYAMLLSVLIAGKEQLMGTLAKRTDASPEELAEQNKLGVEVGLLKNEKDERSESSGIAEQEARAKKLDGRIAELQAGGGDPAEIDALKKERAGIEGGLKARRSRVADLQGNKGKLNNLLTSYGGGTSYDSGGGGGGAPKKDTHLGHAWEHATKQIAAGMLDPWSVVDKVFSKVMAPSKKKE